MEPDGLYIGLISGTSADGVDAALVAFENSHPRLVAHHLHPIPDSTRQRLISLFTPNDLQIDLMGELDVEMGQIFADAANTLMQQAGVSQQQICAIGSHGQTIRHRPSGQHPFTLQIGDPNVIALGTGVNVVGDFRRRDMAQGGQGAPLAPLFHQAILSHFTQNRVVLNLGGIANITFLPAQGTPLAMDTGPASGLMDSWCQQHQGTPFDKSGHWAADGKVCEPLVEQWLMDPYFALAAPKSTGKEYFHLPWAMARAEQLMSSITAVDVQASLLELTARSISMAISDLPTEADSVLVCGGGVHNDQLMKRLRALIRCPVETTQVAGVAPDWVEAMCFAWLAKCHLEDKRLNTNPFTGAQGQVLLGGLYKA